MSNLFEIHDLAVGFRTFEGEKRVLEIEALHIGRGETYGLVGESGAGKTVLALTILGLLPKPAATVHHGQILFDGQDLLQKSERELHRDYRGKRITMIFQDPMSTLNPVFTTGAQIGQVIQKQQGLHGQAAHQRALELLNLVKMPDAASTMQKYPHELSGGQRQRMIIAMALACGTEFLIADEPTRNLDVTIQAGILKLIGELQKELGLSVLFIANNMGLVNVTCDRAGILYRGRIIEEGRSAQIVRAPRHPYTRTLISAIPSDRSEKLKAGTLALKPEAPHGCAFYARCPLAVARCQEEVPPQWSDESGRQVACFRANEIEEVSQ